MKNTARRERGAGEGEGGTRQPAPAPPRNPRSDQNKGGGWACGYSRRNASRPFEGHGAWRGAAYRTRPANRGEGYSPSRTARSTANKDMLKQGCAYRPARPQYEASAKMRITIMTK